MTATRTDTRAAELLNAADKTDALMRICQNTLDEVEQRKHQTSLDEIRDQALDAPPPRGFIQTLAQRVGRGTYGLIAEIKKASPSGGLIRPEFDPAELARAYQAGGAACLSVLTDGAYFQGHPDHLKAARNAVDLPVLRKDFILDPWQIYESRVMGADCVLLIMAALSDGQAVELESLARALDMDVLVEVHDAAELQRALGLQTRLIGINNRNLKTLKTDLKTTIDLAPQIPVDRLLVSESGIRTHDDVKRLSEAGAFCFLVGESMLRQPDVTKAAHSLLGLVG